MDVIYNKIITAIAHDNLNSFHQIMADNPHFDVNYTMEEAEGLLVFAVELKKYDLMKALIHAGADVNVQDHCGLTALMINVMEGDDEKSCNQLRLLLDSQADINLLDKDGYSALMFAASRGFDKSLALLLSHAPHLDYQNHLGETALLIATREAKIKKTSDALNCFTSLVKAGARVDLMDNSGRTALSICDYFAPTFALHNNMVELLSTANDQQKLLDLLDDKNKTEISVLSF